MDGRVVIICGGGGHGGGVGGGGNCSSLSALHAVFTNHAVEFTRLLKNNDAPSLVVVPHYLSPQENGNLHARPHAFTPPLEDRKLSWRAATWYGNETAMAEMTMMLEIMLFLMIMMRR